jgi:hypothetical protein
MRASRAVILNFPFQQNAAFLSTAVTCQDHVSFRAFAKTLEAVAPDAVSGFESGVTD